MTNVDWGYVEKVLWNVVIILYGVAVIIIIKEMR